MTDVARLLRFGSRKHVTIMSALKERFNMADEELADRHDKWRKNEERYLAYIPETEEDAVNRMRRDAGHGPQTTTLVIPMSYALMMTWHTYMVTVLLGRSPIHQWEGRTVLGEKGKMPLESLMDYQTRVGQHLVPYYVWMLDTGKYGLGIVGHYWTDETSFVTEVEEVPVTFAGLPVPGKSQRQNVVREIPGYEGNKLYNIHPTKAWFDPRVPLMEFQRGEFCIVDVGEVSKGSIQGNPEFFNKDVAATMSKTGKLTEEMRSSQIEWPEEDFDLEEPHDVESVGSHRPKEYYVKLRSRDWGLGDNRDSEVWVFTVLDQQVIIGARPLGSYAQRFPVDIQEHEPDGHQLTKRSFLEILGPMQDFMDWLVNTHRLNVAKALNDTLIVDPSLVHMSDVRDPLPGKLIRAKPRAFGQGLLDKSVFQLKMQDVTQQHLGTTSLIMEMMQRVSGVTEQVMGMLQPGGRKSATEIRTSATFGVNRLKTEAEFLSASAWQPLAQTLLQNSQQWMSREQQLRIVGESGSFPNAQELEKFLTVTPEDIRGFYDYVPVDGTLPVDRIAQSQMLVQLLGQMGQVPGVLAQYDMGGVFGWIGELIGAKGLKNFKIQLTPDEIVRKQMAEGNLLRREDVTNAVGTEVPDAAFIPSGGEGSEGDSEGGGSEGGEETVANADGGRRLAAV